MKKFCFVSTIPAAMNSFMREHIIAAVKNWPVLVCSHPQGADLLNGVNARYVPIRFERKISPWRDLCTLWQLYVVFRREGLILVHSIMPKTGLLSMAAAWLARVPNRLHTFTGQVWATRRGWKRYALKQFDRLIALLATRVLVDSPSQRAFLIAEGVVPEAKALVLGNGSICGVDARRFHPDSAVRKSVRKEINIPELCTVILFLGRLNRDKGIMDLASAFVEIARQRSDVFLVLVGPEEDLTFAGVKKVCRQAEDRLRYINFTPDPERFMAMADIFCLPSYREGFGQVIIEAAASGVPSVASRIYGVTDAVEDGKTGILFTPGNVSELMSSLLRLVDDKLERTQMGEQARHRAVEMFSSQAITKQLLALYRQLVE